MWFIFMNSIKDLIGLTDIHCELLGDCVDNSRIIQLIGRKGYNIVAQLYALLLSKLGQSQILCKLHMGCK